MTHNSEQITSAAAPVPDQFPCLGSQLRADAQGTHEKYDVAQSALA